MIPAPTRYRRHALRAAVCALLLGAAAGASLAADDHDRARQALEAGEVLPLRSILERVEREFPGQVIDVELERDGDAGGGERWVYKIKLLRGGGALVKLRVDARDGRLLGSRDKRREKAREHGGTPPPSTLPGAGSH